MLGVTLLVPSLAERLTKPLVALGDRMAQSADRGANTPGSSIVPSLVLGVATGLLWAPCAGPVLGLILTGAALEGASAHTTLLLLAYALGAATSLALALLVGGRVFAAMKRSLGVGEWVRRGLGAAVLVGVAAIAMGLDTGFLTQLSIGGTASLEQGLLDKLQPMPAPSPASVVMQGGAMQGDAMMAAGQDAMMAMKPKASDTSVLMKGGGAMMAANPQAMMAANPAMSMKAKIEPAAAEALPVEGNAPPLTGAVEWLNSPPLTAEALKGKVVLVDFWTYSCINCLRAIPYVKAWAEKYRDQGLVVIGVHAPEFAFEKNVDNVKKAVADLKIDYPVAVDNDYAIWRAFGNQYWPAHYFIDAQGRIRHHHFGEGDYDGSEKIIQQLLAEAGNKGVSGDMVAVNATGAQAAADDKDVQSPETYVGYERADNFASAGGAVQDAEHGYDIPALRLNEWGLGGNWTVGKESATSGDKGAAIAFKFHARDLHLVLGPAASGAPVHFRVTVDGLPPGDSHGADTSADGLGLVDGQRLYQLVRQNGAVADHVFKIEFLDPGAQAFAFTFG